MKKLNKNKLGKGLVSLFAIIILMSLILAGTFYYHCTPHPNMKAKIIVEINAAKK